MTYTPPTADPAIGITYTFDTLAAKITDISFGGLKVETKEATNQSTAKVDGIIWKEFIAGLADAGTVTFKSEFSGVMPAMGKNAALSIVVPVDAGTKTIACQAILAGFKIDMKFGDVMMADIEFKITGAITIT